MSALKVFRHDGDREHYVGRLAFDGHEVYAEPEPGYELAMSRLLNDAATTANATYRKSDGDAFLRAMASHDNAYTTTEYVPDDENDDTPFERQDNGSFRHPRTGETLWGDQYDGDDDDEPEKYAAVDNPAFNRVSKGMTQPRPRITPASSKPLPMTTKPPVPTTPPSAIVMPRVAKPDPLPALPQWTEGRTQSTGRTFWTHRDTGERRTQDEMPQPQRLKPETVAAREAKAASPPSTTIHPRAKRTWDAIMPHQSVTPESAAAMVGAPNGSDVDVRPGFRDNEVGISGTSHQVRDMDRTIKRDADGKLTIHNNLLTIRKKHRGGLGQQIFAGQVENAFNHGVDQIKTIGGKSRSMNGYVTWPKFGYNALLDSSQVSKAKAAGIDAKDVLDLMKTPAGQELWKKIGDQVEMTFDLSPGSKSMQQLAAYRQGKGLPPLATDENSRQAAIAKRSEPHHMPRSTHELAAMREGFGELDDIPAMHEDAAKLFESAMKPRKMKWEVTPSESIGGQPGSFYVYGDDSMPGIWGNNASAKRFNTREDAEAAMATLPSEKPSSKTPKEAWQHAYKVSFANRENAVNGRERQTQRDKFNVGKEPHPDLVDGLAATLYETMKKNARQYGTIPQRWDTAYWNALHGVKGKELFNPQLQEAAKAWMDQHVPEVLPAEPERHEKRPDATNELMALLRRWGPSDPRSVHYAQSVMALLDRQPELRRDYDDADLAYLRMLAEREPKRFEMTKEELAAAVKDVATPTDGQKDAGNYKKAHIWWKGLAITIETPKGKSRNPEWPPLKDNYGYIKRTISKADGDHVDVFVCDDHLDSDIVFVVNQIDVDGKFDEHKCVLGQNNVADAKAAYLRNYTDGWKCGPITPMTITQFKAWLADGDTGEEVEPLKYDRDHHENVAEHYARTFNDMLDADRPVTRAMREQADAELAGGDFAINYAAGRWAAMRAKSPPATHTSSIPLMLKELMKSSE